jgi:hypothetical protein
MNQLASLTRQVQYLFIELLFASFAVVQSAKAVDPESDEADPNTDVAEENDAISDLGNDIEAAVGQLAIKPNQKVMQIKNFQKSLQCAGGKVILSFKVMVTFRQKYVGFLLPHSIKFLGFRGTAVAGGRKLEAKKLRLRDVWDVNKDNKSGRFSFGFEVTGLGLPVSSPFRLFVGYRDNFYKWREGKVRSVAWDKRSRVICP